MSSILKKTTKVLCACADMSRVLHNLHCKYCSTVFFFTSYNSSNTAVWTLVQQYFFLTDIFFCEAVLYFIYPEPVTQLGEKLFSMAEMSKLCGRHSASCSMFWFSSSHQSHFNLHNHPVAHCSRVPAPFLWSPVLKFCRCH